MSNHHDTTDIFHRAWKIIERDENIPPENKEAIFKLIKVLIEAAETSVSPRNKNAQIRTFTQEIISKHALMAMVKQQADELDALKKLSLTITSSLNLQTVLDSVVSEANRLVKDSRAAYIYLYIDNELNFGASLNDQGEVNKLVNMPRANGLTQQVVRQKESIIIEDMAAHPLYKNNRNDWEGSIISIPLKVSGELVGVMNLSRSVAGGFTKSELRLLDLLADQAAVAISNARLHQMVTELANTDIVTGLPNRRALDDRLPE